MNHTLKRSGNRTTLTLGGELTLIHADALKETLLVSLQEGGDVTVRFEKVIDMDLSCLQLFCSAHRTAAGAGQRLIMDIEDAELFHRIRSAAGFIRERGCTDKTGDTCLWLEGGGKCQS